MTSSSSLAPTADPIFAKKVCPPPTTNRGGSRTKIILQGAPLPRDPSNWGGGGKSTQDRQPGRNINVMGGLCLGGGLVLNQFRQPKFSGTKSSQSKIRHKATQRRNFRWEHNLDRVSPPKKHCILTMSSPPRETRRERE